MVKSRTEALLLSGEEAALLRAMDAVAKKTSNDSRQEDLLERLIGLVRTTVERNFTRRAVRAVKAITKVLPEEGQPEDLANE